MSKTMDFKQKLDNYKKEIDEELASLLNEKINSSNDDFIKFTYEKIKEYVLCGGKRLRPILMIMVFKALGGTNKEIIKAALAIELLHNSTLVHDDIMDEDEKRRDKPTINKIMKEHFLKINKESSYNGSLFNKASSRFSVSNSICNGNILYSFGEHCLASAGFEPELINKALSVYSDAYSTVNNGQILDVLYESKHITEKEYLRMVEQKTANLFKASAVIGAILAKADEKQIILIEKYALNIGIAFQLKDDLLDLRDEKGREAGTDIKKGKKTLLIIKAVEKATAEQKKILFSIFGKENASKGEIGNLTKILEDAGAISHVNNLAKDKIAEAKRRIDSMENKYELMSLAELIEE